MRRDFWDFAGQPIRERYLLDIERLGDRLNTLEGRLAELPDLLQPNEVTALRRRRTAILARKSFPDFYEGDVPWPLI